MTDERWHPAHHGFRPGPLGIASVCNVCQCLVSYGGEQIHRERCKETQVTIDSQAMKP